MQFISSKLFSAIKNMDLNSSFKTLQKIAQFSNLEFNETDIQTFNPNIIFESLQKNIINDLTLLQTFTLMGWADNRWRTPNGYQAMKNWWLSAFEKEKQGDSTLRIVMVLRIVLADTERYPAPKDVVQLMGEVFQDLFDDGQCTFEIDYGILNSIISQDAKQLAQIAFLQKKSINTIIHASGFPTKLPIIQNANEEWLKLWFQHSSHKKLDLKTALTEVLNNSNTLDSQITLTNCILNDVGLPKDISNLKNEVKKYPEIANWLKKVKSYNNSINTLINYYQSLTNINSRRLLSCWIGVGNYEQLKSMIYNLADLHYSDNDDWALKSRKAQKNRYLFWEDYQLLFEEIWLLLPASFQYISRNYSIDNIRKLENYSYPIAVFKISNYYIFQPFVSNAKQAQLFVIKDLDNQVDPMLSEPNISINQLLSLSVLFKHEHNFGWQPELKIILKNKMNI